MPITTFLKIALLLAEGSDSPELPPDCNIHLVELPPAGSGSFKLIVMDWLYAPLPLPGQRQAQETLLDPEVSQRLTELAAALPDESMAIDRLSLDGIEFSLFVQDRGKERTFHWKSGDWRYAPDEQKEAWKRVESLGDYVFDLVQQTNDR